MTTQTQTITDFLLARIAEDEALARAAGGGAWSSPESGYGSGAVEDAEGIVVYDEGYPTEDQASHIARHSPARVLAECEAKRRIVAIAQDQIRLGEQARGWDNWRDMALQSLSALASVYADHPDYRAEWCV